jgi:hypothetical protein
MRNPQYNAHLRLQQTFESQSEPIAEQGMIVYQQAM